MKSFKEFFEAHWYDDQEYRLAPQKPESGVKDFDQMFKDIAAKEGDPSKILISNSVLNKIGFNPRTSNRTPAGQYFYPLTYVLKRGYKALEWGVGRQYAIIVKIKPDANIFVITTEGVPNIKDPGFNIQTYDFPYKDQLIQRCGGWDEFIKLFNYYFKVKGWDIKSNCSILWIMVYGLAAQEKPPEESSPGGKRHEYLYGHGTGRNYRMHMSERMTAIFRSFGIDGFYDTGTGTIHPNEKTQCLMLNLTKVTPITTIDLTSSKPGGYNPAASNF